MPTDSADHILVVTKESIADTDCEILGLVVAASCFSKSAVGDLVANVKNWTVGGELHGYTRMLEDTAQFALVRLRQQAAAMGADAVVAFRFVTSDVAQGAAELIAYGTAVRFR